MHLADVFITNLHNYTLKKTKKQISQENTVKSHRFIVAYAIMHVIHHSSSHNFLSVFCIQLSCLNRFNSADI